MSSRHVGGKLVVSPVPVKLTAGAPTSNIAVGDFLGMEVGYAVPAQAFTWDTDTATTQTAFAAAFCGISSQRSRAGVLVAVDPRDQKVTVCEEHIEYQGYLQSAAQLGIGTYVGLAKNASSNHLTQELVSVPTKARAIGSVSRRMSASGTIVYFKPLVTTKSSYSPTAQAYFAAVVADGGSLSSAVRDACATWFNASAAYRSKILRANFFCTDALAGVLVPIIRQFGTTKDTNTGFIAGDYAQATGLLGNGIDKYLDTGLEPVAAGLTAANVGIWAFVSALDEIAVDISPLGVLATANFDRCEIDFTSDTVVHERIGADTTGEQYSTIAAPYVGLWGAQGSALGSRLYKDGAGLEAGPVVSSAWASSALPTIPVFAHKFDAGAGAYFNGRLGGYLITKGLTDLEVAAMYTDLLAFQHAEVIAVVDNRLRSCKG